MWEPFNPAKLVLSSPAYKRSAHDQLDYLDIHLNYLKYKFLFFPQILDDNIIKLW